MKIQFNTDHSVEGNARQSEFFSGVISEKLDRFSQDVTRVEVHLSDENGDKKGVADKRCTMEARVEGRAPIAVTNHADTIEKSVNGAIDKMKASLASALRKD